MAQGDDHPLENGAEVNLLSNGEFGSFDFDGGHENQKRMKKLNTTFLGSVDGGLGNCEENSRDHEKDCEAKSECKVADVRNSEDESGDEDIDESGFEEDDPSKVHQLVVAEAWNRPANENEEEDEDGNFRQEAADVQ